MSDPDHSYRTREEIKAVQTEQDPIRLFANLVVERKDVRMSVYKEVDQEVEQAKADQWPEISEISTNVYAKPLENIRGNDPWELH
ncbi:hypothetical protein PUN28_010020 [Cardiocondyla obscurior]|uniref:Dehydrogenase E1 component domain-containing protein n=1 Tax=Cardiocondyla obscurior TaxID=286306 RepID=A0AAW2FMZ5_9HYME